MSVVNVRIKIGDAEFEKELSPEDALALFAMFCAGGGSRIRKVTYQDVTVEQARADVLALCRVRE